VLDSSSNNNNLSGNNTSNNSGGISLESSSNNNLTGNTVSDNSQQGISLYSSSNNTLANNTVNSNTEDGIELSSSSNYNNLSGNNAYNNSGHGIRLSSSSNNTLTNNTVNSNTEDGIELSSSSNNILSGNSANSNDRHGIYLRDSNNNTLTSNTANSNGYKGINLRDSNNNLIYNNYFNNMNNAYDNGNNIWNITKTAGTNIVGGPHLGGNYWSDYEPPHALFSLDKNFGIWTQNDSLTSGTYDSTLSYHMDIYNEDDESDTVLDNLTFSIQAENITDVDWEEYADLNESYAEWRFPSKFVVEENEGFGTGVDTAYSEPKYLNLNITRWFNQTLFNETAYQLVNFSIEFKDKNFEWLWGGFNANEHEEVYASIVPGTFNYEAPLDGFEEWDHGI
jgi:parallel beta-helix repeat protein